MSCPSQLSPWQHEVSTAFPRLSTPHVWGLVLWSAGIALTGAAGITQISALLAQVLEQQEFSVFQRLREWYLERDQKSGSKRQELDVTRCFAPLLCWIIRRWVGPEKRLALVLDATTLGEWWTVLALCVVIRQCSIPVAWKVIGAHEKGSWRPHWEALLEEVRGTVPTDWFVLVLADRGLYAHWLFDAIVKNGWHPFLRISTTVKARPCDERHFDWISHWMPTPGTQWQGRVDCFVAKKCRLMCTLLMQWQEGDEYGWAVITDLAPEETNVAWYGVRCWVECGFKDFKRGGFGWHYERMKQAGRVERLWLVMAVAQLWIVSLGTQAESQMKEACPQRLPEQHIARTRRNASSSHRPARRLSCAMRGRLVLLASLLKAEALPACDLVPESWPASVMSSQRKRSASQEV